MLASQLLIASLLALAQASSIEARGKKPTCSAGTINIRNNGYRCDYFTNCNMDFQPGTTPMDTYSGTSLYNCLKPCAGTSCGAVQWDGANTCVSYAFNEVPYTQNATGYSTAQRNGCSKRHGGSGGGGDGDVVSKV